jgi:hypothetical protein
MRLQLSFTDYTENKNGVHITYPDISRIKKHPKTMVIIVNEPLLSYRANHTKTEVYRHTYRLDKIADLRLVVLED